MKGFVTAFAQVQNAVAAALGFTLTPVSTEDKFIWIFGVFGITSWVVGTLFFITFRKLDAQEAELNAIGTGEREGFEKQHRKGAYPVNYPTKYFQARRVAPMDIFEDHQHRTLACQCLHL